MLGNFEHSLRDRICCLFGAGNHSLPILKKFGPEYRVGVSSVYRHNLRHEMQQINHFSEFKVQGL